MKEISHHRNSDVMGYKQGGNASGTRVDSNMNRIQNKVPGTTPTGKKSSKKV